MIFTFIIFKNITLITDTCAYVYVLRAFCNIEGQKWGHRFLETGVTAVVDHHMGTEKYNSFLKNSRKC